MMLMKNIAKSVICHEIKGKEFEVETSKLTFRPAVYGIIIKNNKILLSKQWDGYDLPGGGVELGEHIEQALIREVKEETGFDIEVKDVVYANSSFFKLPVSGKNVQSIHLYFESEIIGGKISTEFLDEDEKTYASQAEWVELSQIKNLKMYTSDKIERVLKKWL